MNRYLLPVWAALLLLAGIQSPASGQVAEHLHAHERPSEATLKTGQIHKELKRAFARTGEQPITELLEPLSKESAFWKSRNWTAEASYLQLRSDNIQSLLAAHPRTLTVRFALHTGEILVVDLYAKSPFSKDIVIRTSDGQILSPGKHAHYRGEVRGHEGSLAGISVFDNEIIGMISTREHGNLIIGKIENSEVHVLYAERSLDAEAPFTCGAEDLTVPGNLAEKQVRSRSGSRSLDNCIRLYLETDHALFVNRGSTQAVENWVAGVFNNVAIMYNNEQINFEISELFIWTTPDGYPTNSSSAALNAFRTARQGFNGNLAHLLALGGNNVGGVAYLDVLCFPSHAFAYSNIYINYNQFPTYSWTIMVITHEMGHNVGSNHTQWCGWPGGAIDNCYTTEGGCPPGPPPTNGGTVMSYCHLTQQGINLQHGFGPLPGNKIRDEVTNAPCLTACSASECDDFDASVAVVHTTCGQSNGSMTFTITGGQSPYLVDIGGGPQQQTSFTGLAAGTYQVTISDDNNCEIEMSVTINPSSSPTVIANGTGTTCGQNNGSITVSASGGTPPYNYNIGNGNQSGNQFTGLAAGSYVVTVTDAASCTGTASYTVGASTPLDATATAQATTCGLNNGSITVSASGGTPPYNYNIGNGNQSGNQFTGLAAGTYTITVTDPNNCSDVVTATVSNSTGVTASATVTHTSCGQNNGSITVSATSNQPPLEYTLNGNTQSSPVFSGLAAGSYSILVEDNGGCTASVSVTVNNSVALVATLTTTDALCGIDQGSITVSVSSGTAPYQYNFGSGFQPSPTIGGLAAGTYTVSVSDAAGCSATLSATIGSSSAILLSGNATPAFCGEDNGTITVLATGGNGSYFYNIGQGFVSDNSFEDLAAGTYTVTVTDSDNCSATISLQVTGVPPLAVSVLYSLDVSCFGAGDGAAGVGATGGIPPYYYAWSHGAVLPEITQLSQGIYTVTVSDDMGCSQTAQVIIVQPEQLVLTLQAENITCHQSGDGQITAATSGGNSPYEYALNGGAFQSSGLFGGLAAGTYTVTVRDESLCTVAATVQITEPAALQLSLQGTDVSCAGGDGSITASASGGTPVYQYSLNGAPYQNSPVFNGLGAGAYTVQVVDDNGCTASASIQLDSPDGISLNATSAHVSCNDSADGSITVSVTGGVPPYNYSLNGGSPQQSNVFDGLIAGSYTILATDATGCAAALTIIITEPDPLLVSLTATDVLCNGQADGTILATPSGGTPGYEYTINNGPRQSDGFFTGLAGSFYTIIVYDNNECSQISTISVEEPDPFTATVSSEDETCGNADDGSITITASGGTVPYSYSLNGGSFTQDPVFANLPAGSYTIHVTDANECTILALQAVILEPDPITASVETDPVSCPGGADGRITIAAAGGTPGYTYSIDQGPQQDEPVFEALGGGVHTVTVYDDNDCSMVLTVTIDEPDALQLNLVVDPIGCNDDTLAVIDAQVTGGTGPYLFSLNGGAFQSSGTFSDLPAGNYAVSVRDANQCETTATVTISEPSQLVATALPGHVSCAGGSDGTIEIQATGGTAPYQFALGNGSFQPNPVFTGLPAGDYTIFVVDAAGCTATAEVSLTEPDPILLSINTEPVSCYGGSDGFALVSASGGNSQSYTYLWSSGSAQASASGLSAGDYTVTVTDASGCTATTIATILQPDPLHIIVVTTQVSEEGADDGTCTALVTGGTGTYTYLWSTGATTPLVTGLAPGIYTVTVTDENECTGTATGVINAADCDLEATIADVRHVSCHGGSDGFARGVALGGTSPFTYTWSDGTEGASLFNTAAGTYRLTITDAAGCVSIAEIAITQPSLLVTAISAEAPPCTYSTDGSITVDATGGTAPYRFAINGGAFQATGEFDNLLAGTYILVTADMNDCLKTDTVILVAQSGLDIELAVTGISCHGEADASVQVVATGGNTPYSYLWENGDTGSARADLAPGTYLVTVTDLGGCTAGASVLIADPQPLEVHVLVTQISEENAEDGSCEAVVSGGTAPYTYAWSNGSDQAEASGLGSGNYIVTVTDAHGCSATAVGVVNDYNCRIYFDSLYVQPPVCYNGTDGWIYVGVAEGSGPVTIHWSNGQEGDKATGLKEGIYWVTVSDTEGCTLTDSFHIIPLQTGPHAVGPIEGPQEVSAGETVVYEISTGTGFDYAWTISGGTIDDGDGTSRITVVWGPAGTGIINLVVTDDLGCTGSAILEVSIGTTSVSGVDTGIRPVVYPNPFESAVHVRWEYHQSYLTLPYQLTDTQGRILLAGQISSGQAINSTGLIPGVYILKVADWRYKLVKYR